jgi:hypothetical protein
MAAEAEENSTGPMEIVTKKCLRVDQNEIKTIWKITYLAKEKKYLQNRINDSPKTFWKQM